MRDGFIGTEQKKQDCLFEKQSCFLYVYAQFKLPGGTQTVQISQHLNH